MAVGPTHPLMAALARAPLVLVAGAAAAGTAAPPPGGRPPGSGTVFTGSYICAQGSTGLALHVDAWPAGRFKFFPTPVSTHRCSGEFIVRGEWLGATQTLTFQPVSSEAWVHNDCDYLPVGLQGHLSDNGLRFSGRVTGFQNCSTFSLMKGGGSSSACFDSDNGALDGGGRTCGDYAEDARRCGTEDDADFTAVSMCCACGGGARGGLATSACFDWNPSATDGDGSTCHWYSLHPEECGLHDTPRFKAEHLCCRCGGGVQAIGAGLRQELHGLEDARAKIAELRRVAGRLELQVERLRRARDLADAVAERTRSEEAPGKSADRQALLASIAKLRAERDALRRNLTKAQLKEGSLMLDEFVDKMQYDELRTSYWHMQLAALLLGFLLLAVLSAGCFCGRGPWLKGGAREARDVGHAVLDGQQLAPGVPEADDCAHAGGYDGLGEEAPGGYL